MSENERFDQAPEEEELTAGQAAAEDQPEKRSKEAKAADKKAKEKAKKKAQKGNRMTRWLREMRSELKKVQWPTWKQVLKNTGVVILCVLVIGIFIWIFDALAHQIIKALMDLFS